MRVLPIVMAVAIAGFATAAFAQQQSGPTSNQPPGPRCWAAIGIALPGMRCSSSSPAR